MKQGSKILKINKKNLAEQEIRTKYITPALIQSGWETRQIGEEVYFTDGQIHVRGNLTQRGKRKWADYILSYKPNIPIAIVEAKDNKHALGAGMQQGLDYARILDIPFVFSSNGDGFLFQDKTEGTEKELSLENFPSPEELWGKYCLYKGITTPEQKRVIEQGYFIDASGRSPRYYQQIAVNRTVEAIAKGQKRILLVMATGTGKTYVAFQIIYRLRMTKTKKRILFLADRNALIDQPRRDDFKHFGESMTVIREHKVEKAYEVYLALYQGMTSGCDEEDDYEKNIYKQFTPDFFDLIVIDECHRGSASEESAWRRILEHFSSATHIGLTATPKETKEVSNIDYFGKPIYTYSLKQGINDGFLAPYRVIRVDLNVDGGWRPSPTTTDKYDDLVEDKIYNSKDYDRTLVIDERRKMVARKITEFLKGTDRFSKTIVFCVDIEHANGMRTALVNENSDLVKENYKYVMKITGDDEEGKNELDNFTNPEERYPVIATTSKLLTTGVDTKTCKLIVLDTTINSMTEFKQMIGRGTRIDEEYGKSYFTILDFKKTTDLFADPDFDGEPVSQFNCSEDDDLGDIEKDEEEKADPIIENDQETGEETEVIFSDPAPSPPIENDDFPLEPNPTPREKIYVNGVNVTVLNEREQFFDNDGKLITESLKDYTKNQITKNYRTLNDFLNKWNAAEKKEVIICELEEQGVRVEDLMNSVNRECDLFDIICHTAFDMPPLTRKERADNVKKRNYFTKYGDTARAVLEALLDKYADEDVRAIEDINVLKINPFSQFGSPIEIIRNNFENKNNYLKAVRELEQELYKEAL